MRLPCSLAAESALQPALHMGRNMPEAGEFDAAVGARQVEVRHRPPGIRRDIAADHGFLEGLAAGQVTHIHETIDEAIVHAVFGGGCDAGKRRLHEIGDDPGGHRLAIRDGICGLRRVRRKWSIRHNGSPPVDL
ncbi:hypothetical protein D3C72_1593680 [compost metagenome]